jgi:hypothetical protein
MKKITLLLFVIAISIETSWAQELKRTIPEPTNAQALFKENIGQITKELESKTGYPISQLKLVKSLPVWHRFFGSKNEEYGYKWPEDMISNFWEYHTPKDVNGMYKTISVIIVYTRLNCDAYPCLLTNTYKLDYISTTSADYAGYKEISKSEINNIALDYFKSGKAKAFSNMVQIDKIDAYNPNDVSSNKKTLMYSLYGELGVYNYDKSTILTTIPGAFSFLLHVTNINDKWIVDSLQLTEYLMSYKDVTEAYKVGVQKEHYQNYETAGFDAIYQTNKKTEKPNGMDEKLIERTNAFYALVQSKGAYLTKADLAPFIESSINYDASPAANNADENFNKLKNAPSIYLLKETTVESGSVVLQDVTLSNGENVSLPTAIVYSNTLVENYKTKKGVPSGKAENEVTLETNTSWVYINNQWYLLDNGAFLMGN